MWCGVVCCAVLCCAVLCRGAALTSAEQAVWGPETGRSKNSSYLTLPLAQSFAEESFSDSKHGSAIVIPIHISPGVINFTIYLTIYLTINLTNIFD